MIELTRRNVLFGASALATLGVTPYMAPTVAAAQENVTTLAVAGEEGQFTYNGKSRGPTLAFKPGETVEIELSTTFRHCMTTVQTM